ncbi:hypothetical protein G176_gp05 [Xanthomonas phage CP1]|uniref:GIY-YIG domain-containing protein n=1 Tax=Xanthomonas phage CP1 TaxID=2994055 RepID=I7GY99_9CAUD|nr:hypothetical protein G176_gp05 [Xanthomonas phage CP1]BAM29077.1 hypothetical protein [Xanthomonas phage CP1]
MNYIDLNQSGIYSITSPSGKRYVGSAVNLRKRWAVHRCELEKGKHHCSALQRAYHKYGGDLEYSVLILCPKEELIKEEQWYLDSSAPGTLYNSSPTAGNSYGVKRSEETRALISTIRTGSTLSAATRAKVSAAMLGRNVSAGTRAKLSAAHMGLKKRNNTSGFVGVSLAKRGRSWQAQVKLLGRQVYLGNYPTAELANQARQNFDRILKYYSHS